MSMANIRRRFNLYRSMLDPRDPDYEELMEPEDYDDEPPFDDDAAITFLTPASLFLNQQRQDK